MATYTSTAANQNFKSTSTTSNDLYKYALGGGTDTVTDAGGTADTLDISDPDGIYTVFNIYRSGTNLVFDFGAQGRITVNGQFNGTSHSIEKLTFDNGVEGPLYIRSGMTGTSADELLVGTSGNDTMYGNGGYDDIRAGAGNDKVYGGAGGNDLFGGAGNDTLYAGVDGDFLVGGLGSDTLNGGTGWDTAEYFENTTGIVANLSGVSKTLSTGVLAKNAVYEKTVATTDTLSNVEKVIGTRFADTFYLGRSEQGAVEGGGGNDTFYAGAANSWGNVQYSDASARVIINLGNTSITVGGVVVAKLTARDGDGGIDSFKLAAGDLAISGTEFGDYIKGRDDMANDSLRGARGNDTIVGGAYADTADYDDWDEGGAGVIVNLSSASVTLGAKTVAAGTALDNYGNTDKLISIESVLGSDLNDLIVGSGSVNYLDGEGGNDTLKGGAGNDSLEGDAGNDVLVGGAGRDWLFGGAGNDIYDFDTLGELVATVPGADYIYDFVRGADKIDLRTIDANTGIAGDQAFAFVSAFSGNSTGKVCCVGNEVRISTDADTAAEYFIVIGNGSPLTASDFYL